MLSTENGGVNHAKDAEEISLVSAIEQTLARDFRIRIQKQALEAAEGSLAAAQADFDLRFQTEVTGASTRFPRTTAERSLLQPARAVDTRDAVGYAAGLVKPTPYGPTLRTGIAVDQNSSSLVEQNTVNQGQVFFGINIPLLKNAGRKTAGAIMDATKQGREAAAFDLIHETASRIMNTTLAYWETLSTARELEILLGYEAQAESLVQSVEALIQARELPKMEVEQAQADLSGKTALRIAGEQNHYRARQNLGLAMGLGRNEVLEAPTVRGEFPEFRETDHLTNTHGLSWMEACLWNRADYLALLNQKKASEILAEAARKNLQPHLELDLEVGYRGLNENNDFNGFRRSLFTEDLEGLNGTGLLRFSWTFGNRQARGERVRLDALDEQNELRIQELSSRILSDISVAFNDLKRSRQELRMATRAVDHFKTAVESEERKLRIGGTTVLDLITIRERLLDARLRWIQTQAKYAQALIRLRFESGTLIPPEPDGIIRITIDTLITEPPSETLNTTFNGTIQD